MIRIGILISGSGSNLQSIINAVRMGTIAGEIVKVISNDEKAYGLTRAAEAGISTEVVKHGDYAGRAAFEEKLLSVLQEAAVELVVLAGFMRVLGAGFLAAFPDRVINIHPALLPSFPGTHGQAQAFTYGVKLAGCTVHFVDEQVDHGPIIMQAAVPVLADDDADRLAARILRCEHKIFPLALALYCAGRLRIEKRKVSILGVDETLLEDQCLISCPV
ncbi:MAG: phosphoribosylglycinamide formyltransferase [Deltaproteobacteria bacterium]|nr:phosphoribosylglycinamide formyltransferase [Deltaproteobacteria bacterium]